MYRLCDLREKQDLGDWRADVIFSDNPWWYADQRKVRKDGKTPTRGIGACHHYRQMKTAEIAALPVADMAADRCHLYMWATAPLLPDAIHVMAEWGFKWCTCAFVWGKTNRGRVRKSREIMVDLAGSAADGQTAAAEFMGRMMFFGPGYYTGSNVEFVLLGRRGTPFRHAKGRKAGQWLFAGADEEAGTGEIWFPSIGHSRKPEQPQDDVEWMYPQCRRRLELFGRRDRGGWLVMGNENLFPHYCSGAIRSGDVDTEWEGLNVV